MTKFNPIQRFLDNQGFLVVDGALASELEARGASLKDALWSAKLLEENPDLIRQVHYDYLSKGADLVTTASYQATYQGFKARGWDSQKADELFQKSITLANEARALFWQEANKEIRQYPLVVASIGPYGAMLADGSEYHGHYGLSVKALMDFHKPRLELLLESGADLVAFETVPSILEAEAIVRLLEDYKGAWAWLSFSCKDEKCISDGTLFGEAANLLKEVPQLVSLGINCTSPEFILPLLEVVESELDKPIVIYPNSGETWNATQKCWIPDQGLMDWKQLIEGWYQKGAKLIGGCCRTTPDDIYRIRKTLEELA